MSKTVQLVLIVPGDVVLDYAFWRPTVQEIIDRNIKCVVRYISFGNSGKRISLEEIQFLHKCGVAILIIFEWTATRANQGRSAGLIDGKFAAGILDMLCYPVDPELAALFAIDTNTVASNEAAHQAYSEAFDEALGDYKASGIYGDNDIISYCILNNITILNWWAGARAWSNNQPPVQGTHVQQIISGSTPQFDNNKVLLPFKAWLPHEEEDDLIMNPVQIAFFEVKDLPGQYMWYPGIDPIPFTSTTDRDVLLKCLGLPVEEAPGGQISQDMYNRLFIKPVAVNVDIPTFPSKILIQSEGTLGA